MVEKIEKDWYKSKTLWFGVLQFACAVGSLLLNEYLTAGILTVTGAASIILRYLTENPIKM